MKYDSLLELAEAPIMAGLGIERCTDRLSMTFIDPSGSPFHREPDWLLTRSRWRLYLETKAYLNDQPDRATANEAKNNRQPGRSNQWHIAETSWSNSVVNNAIVQRDFGFRNILILLPDSLFKICGAKSKRCGKLPAATVTTLNRLADADMWWIKTSDLQGYMRSRDVAEAWHEQHTPQLPQEPAQFIHLWCKTADHFKQSVKELRAEGYSIKRGTKTTTSCVLQLPTLH